LFRKLHFASESVFHISWSKSPQHNHWPHTHNLVSIFVNIQFNLQKEKYNTH
jgi:hypothetical protein